MEMIIYSQRKQRKLVLYGENCVECLIIGIKYAIIKIVNEKFFALERRYFFEQNYAKQGAVQKTA